METLIYWLYLLAKFLIVLILLRISFWGVSWLVRRLLKVDISLQGWRPRGFECLSIKTNRLELQVNRVYLSIRWFDSTCRHFFKINVDGVHLEYYSNGKIMTPTSEAETLGSGQSNNDRASSSTKKIKFSRKSFGSKAGPSRKRRFLYWCLCKLLKRVEFSVRCLEMWVEQRLEEKITLITAFQVQSRLAVIAKPLPNKELAVSIEVEKANGQLLLQTDTPCSTTDDGLFTLTELSFSSKVFLFLRPLESVEFFHSLQINTVPLSFSLLHEDTVSYVAQCLSLLSKKHQEADEEPSSKEVSDGCDSSEQSVSRLLLPQKLELVLEDIKLQYQASISNRVLSSKLTRISVAADVNVTDPPPPALLPGLSVTIGMQGMIVNDSVGRQVMKLQQLRLVSESSSACLSNRVHVDSLQGALWETETIFWLRHAQDIAKKLRTKLQLSHRSTKDSTTHSSSEYISRLFTLPVSVATTLEASDWSVQLRPDAVSLQSKEPLSRMVAAAFVASIQWEPPAKKESTTTIKASIRIEDAYFHVPGYHPSVESYTSFRQRPDNPSVLPSLRKHLWGRVASLGSLILKAEKEIMIVECSSENIDPSLPSLVASTPGGQRTVKFTNDPLKIVGDGGSMMVEWSQPTVVALTRSVDHLMQEYKLFTSTPSAVSDGGREKVAGVATGDDGGSKDRAVKLVWSDLPRVELKFRLTDINAFLYSLVPEPPAAMLRIDALSVSSAALPSLTFDLHGMLLDDVHLQFPEQDFLCSSVANLPQGVGVATVTSSTVKYDHSSKDVGVSVAKVSSTWTTTAHCCLFNTASHLIEDIKQINGVLRASEKERKTANSESEEKPESLDEVVAMGEVTTDILKRMPLTLSVNLESVEAVALLDRRAKVSLNLNTVLCNVKGGVVTGGVSEIAVKFDNHQIFSLEEFAAVFPHQNQQLSEERSKVKQKLERQTNSIVWLKASSAKLIFPYKYKFAMTFDKLMNIKKFLQKIHSAEGVGAGVKETQVVPSRKKKVWLPPDLFLECEDIILQISDDPFEVKLKANYELMCDEYEQKTRRREMLGEKLKKIKEDQGEIAVSRKKVQSLYDSLELKNTEIYCKRAKEMYSSSEPLRTGLFIYSMKETKLLAMFDPSMLGEKKLVQNLKDIDSISPLPDHKYAFSTLWGGYVSGSTQKLQMQLRDYPHPLLEITEITIRGRIMFAEQEAQERETRSAVVEVGHPYSNVTVKRKLPPLKYYYDFEMTSHTWDMSYGPCLEPVMAETSLGFGLLTSASVDPSRPLPYWDKLRLLFHGTIHLVTDEMRLILPSTFNPYNMVEYLELVLSKLDVQLLTNTQLILNGAVQLFVHTASKYDSCQILNFPRAKATLNLNWFCGGKSPNRHHYVVRCAPDKIPVQPDKQEHDSYSGFRSQNLDLELKLDVLPSTDENSSQPDQLLLYSSTLRCLQQYQMLIQWNVTRPTRRGKYFNNMKPKRPPMMRHWRHVSLAVSFPKSVLHYWSSKAHQRGIKCTIDEASFSMNNQLSLVPYDSGLTQRPKANWTINYCSGNVRNILAHVKIKTEVRTAEGEIVDLEIDQKLAGDDHTHNQSILLSMEELKYSRREEKEKGKAASEEDDFTHQLETINTRLLWNPSNRNVVLGLYDAYRQAQMLKRDLSTEALKSLLLKFETPSKGQTENQETEPEKGESDVLGSPRAYQRQHPRPRHASSGNTMLDQLLSDMNNKFVTYVDERASSDPLLKGVHAGSMNDVIHRNWLITLSNTQIALQGLEKTGYILVSSHIAQVFGREHEPQLNEGDLVTKKSWVAKVQELQYFSTVGSTPELQDSNCIPWLPLSVIQPPTLPGDVDPNIGDAPKDEEEALNVLLSALGPDQGKLEDLGRSLPRGEVVGGLVSCVLLSSESEDQQEGEGGGDTTRKTIQLQRIATRCHCQIFYITYGEQPELETDVKSSPPPAVLSSTAGGLTSSNSETVDTFTFRYPTVDICTTSSQYTMIIDILNNLLLHKEPKKKEAIDRHARMQFTLQLSSNIQNPRKPVQLQQSRVRTCVRNVRKLETQLYLEQRSGDLSPVALQDLETQLAKAKEDLTTAGLRLRAMIRAFKENQLYVTPLPTGETEQEAPEPVRRIEVWVDDAHWWLTHDDGQLQLADVCFTNFSYNRISFSDDSGEHRLELGTFKVSNLMPNTPSVYQEVLIPYDPKSKHIRVDKNISLRVYCKDKAPVAGISVKEHLEVNVVPLAVCLTAKFYQTMQDFFFPKAEEGATGDSGPDHSYLFGPTGAQPSPAYGEGTDGNTLLLTRGSSTRKAAFTASSNSVSSSIVAPPSTVSTVTTETKDAAEKGKHAIPTVDDVEKMKERATHIKTFIYVKIPQITVCITYKSENVSFKDLQNQRVVLPILEYHNRNWTWTDMLMEVKKDYKNAIISQTLKSAIGINKDSDEMAGLSSPKTGRRTSSDLGELLLGRASPQKSSKGRKLFGKLGASKDEHEDTKRKDNHKSDQAPAITYQPPLSDPDVDLKRTMRKLTKLSQDAQK